MRKRKPQIDETQCRPGSIEQQLDMCETGQLRGEEQERRFTEHPNFNEDMSTNDREGDEMSGDEHSAGLQGGDPELESQDFETGMPGDVTRLEEYRRKRAASQK